MKAYRIQNSQSGVLNCYRCGAEMDPPKYVIDLFGEEIARRCRCEACYHAARLGLLPAAEDDDVSEA